MGSQMKRRFKWIPVEGFMEQLYVPGDALPNRLRARCQAQLAEDVESFQGDLFNADKHNLYRPLCYLAQLCFDASGANPGLICRETANWPEFAEASDNDQPPATSIHSSEEQRMQRKCERCRRKPDLSIFFDNDATRTAIALTEEAKSTMKCEDDRKPWLSRIAFGHTVCFVEVKSSHSQLTFRAQDPPPEPSETLADYSLRCQEGLLSPDWDGKIAEYAAEVHLRQHRLFLFSIAVSGSTARLVRWDRAGAIVSGTINYHSDLQALLTFFYRLGRMSREELGYDPTVEPASDLEIQAFTDFANSDSCDLDDIRRKMVQQAVSDPLLWPIHAINVPQEDGPSRRFLVGRTRSGSQQPIGRGSKGYIAFDPTTKCIHFMKDAWRPIAPSIEAELDIYKHLADKGVVNIPTVLCGGDVASTTTPVQETVSHELFPEEDKVLRRVHCRIVFKKVYRPISTFSSPAQMVNCIWDAFNAHRMAWEFADILHRDISEANIMIDDIPDPTMPEGIDVHGVLNDWDLCKRKAALSSGIPSLRARSGTWVFLSALLLKYPKKPYELSDDLESWVHLVNWLTLRYYSHDLDEDDLAFWIESIYYRSTEIDGVCVGGKMKMKIFRDEVRVPFTIGKAFQPNLYRNFVEDLNAVVRQHYRTIDEEKYQKLYGIDNPPEPTRPVMLYADPVPVEIIRPYPYPSERSQWTTQTSSTTARSQDPIPDKSPLQDHEALYRVLYNSLLNLMKHDEWIKVRDHTVDNFWDLEF